MASYLCRPLYCYNLLQYFNGVIYIKYCGIYFVGICPRTFLPHFILLLCYFSYVCFLLMFHPCCSHARGILCGIHTSLSIVHAKSSLVFRSLNDFICTKDCFKHLYNSNDVNNVIYNYNEATSDVPKLPRHCTWPPLTHSY